VAEADGVGLADIAMTAVVRKGSIVVVIQAVLEEKQFV
jgi:hypothetical protein